MASLKSKTIQVSQIPSRTVIQNQTQVVQESLASSTIGTTPIAEEISGKHPLMCYNPIVGDWVNPLAKLHLQPLLRQNKTLNMTANYLANLGDALLAAC